MTECVRIRADAPGLAALRADAPERIAAMAHARGCPECERALREAERLQSLIVLVEPDPLPVAAFERASREIRAALRREARWRLVGSIVALCASVVVFVGFARSRSTSPADWALAAVLWALAVALAATASKRPVLATVLAVIAAGAATALSGATGPLAPSLGLECVATELASAATVVVAVWVVARHGTTRLARSAVGAAAAAGALAGDAALQVTCSAHTAAPHLLAFHVGGVLLAAAGATLIWRPPRRAAF